MPISHTSLSAFTVDSSGIIIQWNHACELATGFGSYQALGQRIQDLFRFPDGIPAGLLDPLASQVWPAQIVGESAEVYGSPVRLAICPEAPGVSDRYSVVLAPRQLQGDSAIADLPLGTVIEELPGIFYVVDESAHLVLWNHRLEEALQLRPDEMKSVEVQQFFDEGERPEITEKIHEAFHQGQSSTEAELVGKRGKRTPFLFHCTRANVGGKPCIFGTGLDMSSRRAMERGLRVRERALYSSVNAIVITCCGESPKENHIEYVNPAFEAMSGYKLDEIKGRDPRFMRIDDCDATEHARIGRAIQARESVHSVLRNRRKNGEVFWNDLRIDPVRNGDGEVTHFVAVLNDITETRHYERRLHHLAHHDPLTGLANRVLLVDRLREAIGRAATVQAPGALAFLDLDNFKHINDNFGHEAGDVVLRAIAERLRDGVREEDTVARFGGDEFVLLLQEQPSIEHAADLLERIRVSINAPIHVAGHDIAPATSIGVSVFPHDGDTVDDVMRAADAAMYHAKALGKNNVQFYSRELGDAVHQHLLLQASLSRAITANELVLGYQPKVSLHSGRIVGAEALLRWQRPGGECVPPDRFIPVAEETGLIAPLGEWVLNQACDALTALAANGLEHLVLSVNLSARQLRNLRFTALLAEIIAVHKVAPERLELEVTESQLMDDPTGALATLVQLKALGVRLSIDDFGTGYSSLSHLRTFPVDYIKIDRSFLSTPYQDKHDVIARAIIALGHNLSLEVVAEGVETADQLRFLCEHNCDQMQGFYFSPAVSLEQLQRMAKRDVRLTDVLIVPRTADMTGLS